VGPNKTRSASYEDGKAIGSSWGRRAADLQWVQGLERIGCEEAAVGSGGVRGGEGERVGKEGRVMESKEEDESEG
jgi:hypothetical protein